jgi:hypothetical protein
MVRLQPSALSSVDEWITKQNERHLSRPEAIRRLIELALKAHTSRIRRIVASGDALTSAAPDAPAVAQAARRKTRQRHS